MQRIGTLALLALASCAGPKQQTVDAPPVVAVSDPNVVTLESALDNRYVPARDQREVIARLRVDTRPLERARRPALNLALAVDTSGSMRGDAIDNARAAALALVDALDDGDRLSVVAFHSGVQVLLPSTAVDAGNRADIKRAISAMEARGTTALAQGLARALSEARTGQLAEGVNRVVLLSDGVPNDENPVRALADNARQHGIAITSLGLGLDYNETLLADVSQRSGGTFHYVEKSDQVAEVFEGEIVRMGRTVARNLSLGLMPGPGVQIVEVIGMNAGRSGRAMHVALGNLSEGEQRDVFVKLAVDGRRDGATVELMDAVLTFQDAVVNAGSLRREVFVSAVATEDAATLEKGVNADIVRDALRADLAGAVVRAIASARAGNLPRAERLLVTSESRARQAADRYDDDSFAAQADEMIELKTSLPSIVPRVQATPTPAPRPRPAPAVETLSTDAPAAVRRNHDRAMGTLNRPRSRAR